MLGDYQYIMASGHQGRRLHRKLLMRRSCRSFSSQPLSDGDLRALREAVRRVPSLGGERTGWAEVVSDERRVQAVLRAVLSTLTGKVNLWLTRSEQPAALVVCCADPARSRVRDGRYLYNVDAALAGEAAVVTAACRGLGSVWMAGIGEREVVREMSLAEGQRVVAVIAVGHPRSRPGLWDGLTQRVLSGRRKPLAGLVHRDRFGVALPVAPPDPVRRAEMLSHAGGPVDETLDPEIPAPTTRFSGAPDADETRVLLDAARWAPNADNAQIWRFVVSWDEARRRRLLEAAGVGEAAQAGDSLLVACCAAPFIIGHRTRQQPFSLIDVPIAALHMALVARAMGHGWNLLADIDAHGLARRLELPDDHRAVCLLMLGVPESGDLAPWLQLEAAREEDG